MMISIKGQAVMLLLSEIKIIMKTNISDVHIRKTQKEFRKQHLYLKL